MNDFKKIGKRKKIYNIIKNYVKNFKQQILSLGVFKFLLLLFGLTSPFFYKLLIDNVLIQKQLNMLIWVCTGYVVLYVCETLVLVYQRVISNKIYNKITFDIRYRIWRNYSKMPITFYEKYNTGDLKNRIDTDVDAFQGFIEQQIINYIFYWANVIITGVILIKIDWKLACFGFIMVPISFWMTKLFGKGVNRSSEEYRKIWGGYENWLQGSIKGWKEIKALVIERNEKKIFADYWHKLSKQFFVKQMYWHGNRSFIQLKDFLITRVNLYFIGGFLVFSGELTVGGLLIFMRFYEQFFGGIGSINNLDMQISNDIPAIERVQEVISLPVEKDDHLIKEVQFKGEIDFNEVTFKYNKSHNEALNNINLKINSKERIAIVGRSGCGKTSLIKILLGLYNPQIGNVRIDGINIKDINPSCLYQNIGVVMQDSILFNLTIKENLLLAKASATDKEIKDACKMACIDDFIESLPESYMTMIGEKGVKLSGGQKQRLAIARVLLIKPNIVIFDEATSSLDHESEKVIHNAIDNIARERTIIFVAHRLSSILSADRVIVMDNGQIIGDGHHSKLLGKNDTYDSLFKEQYESLRVS